MRSRHHHPPRHTDPYPVLKTAHPSRDYQFALCSCTTPHTTPFSDALTCALLAVLDLNLASSGPLKDPRPHRRTARSRMRDRVFDLPSPNTTCKPSSTDMQSIVVTC